MSRPVSVHFESGLSPQCLLRRPDRLWLDALGVCGQPRLLSRGRDCLYVVARTLRLRDGDELLLPAFICQELIETIRSWGFGVRLYDVNTDLTVPVAEATAQVTPATRAVLYVNYFGIPQPTSVVRGLRQLGLPLIEDSCQAPFSPREPGAEPDFAFTSLRKYLPVPDGAVLDVLGEEWREGLPRSTRSHGRLVFWRALALHVRGAQERRDRRVLALLADEFFACAEVALNSGRGPMAMHWWSRLLIPHLGLARVRTERRANYAQLAASLESYAAVRPALAALPPAACPYGLPTLVSNNRLWRDALGQRNIRAAILWDCSGSGGVFPASQWLGEHLLVLPVTQNHSPDDMAAIAAILREYHGDQ